MSQLGVYSLTVMENPEDRRGALRFELGFDLQFREIGEAPGPVQGSGKTIDISSDAIPNGTWMANSHGQDATAMIAAATDGPAADDVATTSTL